MVPTSTTNIYKVLEVIDMLWGGRLYALANNLEIRKLIIFIFYEYLFPKVRCTYFVLEKVIGISGIYFIIGKCNLGWSI
jgi:hypothetical protein